MTTTPAIHQIHPKIIPFLGHDPSHPNYHPGHDQYHSNVYLQSRHAPFVTSTRHTPGPNAPPQPLVVVGSGPAGLVFLCKYLEEHQKHIKQNQHADSRLQVLLLEKRETFVYPQEPRAREISIASPTPQWALATSWPRCFEEHRFKDISGKTGSLRQCLQAGMHYTVLRYDLLLLCSQMWHAIFGNHNDFHFVSNANVPTSSLKELHDGISKYMPDGMKRDVQLYHKFGQVPIICSLGDQNGGINELFPNNKWEGSAEQTFCLRLHLNNVAIGRPSQADDYLLQLATSDWKRAIIDMRPIPDSRNLNVDIKFLHDQNGLKQFWLREGFTKTTRVALSQLHRSAPATAINVLDQLHRIMIVYDIAGIKRPLDMTLTADHRTSGYWSKHWHVWEEDIFVAVGAAGQPAPSFLFTSLSSCKLAEILQQRPANRELIELWNEFNHVNYIHRLAPRPPKKLSEADFVTVMANAKRIFTENFKAHYETQTMGKARQWQQIKSSVDDETKDSLLNLKSETFHEWSKEEHELLERCLTETVKALCSGKDSKNNKRILSSMLQVDNIIGISKIMAKFMTAENCHSMEEQYAASMKKNGLERLEASLEQQRGLLEHIEKAQNTLEQQISSAQPAHGHSTGHKVTQALAPAAPGHLK